MNTLPPSSIKNVGIIVAVFAAMIIFGNGSGALVWTFLGMSEELDSAPPVEFDMMDYLLSHYRTMCMVMVSLGIGYFIGGINLMKHKLWANRLVTVVSILLILAFMTVSVFLMFSFQAQEGVDQLAFIAPLSGLCWSAPLVLLIHFLNKHSIKQYFS